MTSEMETNIVAVERVKEYSETPQEVRMYIELSRGENSILLNVTNGSNPQK